MKIAVCYSGMFRDFLKCYDNHKNNLIDKYDCDVYMNLWDVYGYGGVFLRINLFEEDYLKEEDIKEILNAIKPKKYAFDSYKKMAPYFLEFAKSVSDHDTPPFLENMLSMNYMIQKAGFMAEESGIKYDLIVRMRTDILFQTDLNIDENIKENTYYVNWNGGWNHETIGDMFGYAEPKTMSKYHKMYDNLKNIWDTFGAQNSAGERLIYLHLSQNNINIEKKDVEIKLYRDTI